MARKLGPLNEEVVYVGGCSTALFMTDSLLLDVRPTKDVDCIVDIVSRSEYYKFSKKLEKQGFKQLLNESVICRWRYDDVILDVMPTDEEILTFGNHWYKEAITKPIAHQLADELIVKSITAPYLLATKIEAFHARGNRDFLVSHDFEDIINVISGRVEIAEEVNLENEELRNHLKSFFEEMLNDDDFITALPAHINEGPATEQRLATVTSRIRKIAGK
ncbi:MAG: nucleotidyl transferase AbiEii/AbiGii toxin family protein [Gammaproteobacteria bacterium]